ncbi:MAG: toprim domain-containing protein [Betaproteobacteria bacterium]|nr:toprim domain-containing protein [Betaproteobacteria bacterium]
MSEIQFREAILQSGMMPPEVITPGKWHKFPGVGKANGNKAGWCRLFDDCTGGVFGCYATGLDEVWQADRGRKWTAEEQATFRVKVEKDRKEREAEEAKRKAEAREAAALIWSNAYPAEKHGYLERKGIQAHGVKTIHADTAHRDCPSLSDELAGLLLVIPMRDESGLLHSLQFIDEAGEKRFLSGGKKKGCYYSIGKPDGVLCIAEGFATAASIHEATGYAVAVAFDCGNLKPVAEALRAKLPDVQIVICADDDNATEGNPGITKAKEAAAAIGGVVAVPDFGEARP